MDRTKFRECKALLFDFGGTIDADGEHWLDRFFALYEGAGLDFRQEEIKRAFYHAAAVCHADPGVPLLGLRPFVHRHVYHQFEALSLHDPEKQKELADRFCDRAEEFFLHRVSLLARLLTRFRVGVVSNFFGNLTRVFEDAGLAGSVEVMIDSGCVGVAKPDPRIFQLALEQLRLPPGSAVFIGDSYERDMIPSAQLGLKTIWLKGPNPRLPEHAPPVDAVITRLSELEVLV
jgi:putative hydrolase of the HAD superfamily